KVTVNFSKPNVTLQGQGFESTIIVWNNSAKNTGTFYSATVDVFATGFVTNNISFKNASPAPKPGDRDGQAVAIRVSGSIDFIFGNGRSFYEKCILNSVATGDGINGAICAQGREYAADDTGFAFVNCRITGSGLILLGRAWRPYSRVVFAHTDMPGIIVPEGWSDWDDPQRDAYHGVLR
uniref:Pectinesterase n=1 Tax=Oryza glaberrima TaxID=4538 RepID=I1P386_ORYGL